jgi:mannose-6-phosphate isomerase-like protein (cupin superfamily)
MSEFLEKVNITKLAQQIGDREENVISRVEDLNVYITSYLGDYPAHKHPKDEFFFVLEGEIELDFKGRRIVLEKGEGLRVPKESVHKPYAKARAVVMKIEPVEFPFEKVSG